MSLPCLAGPSLACPCLACPDITAGDVVSSHSCTIVERFHVREWRADEYRNQPGWTQDEDDDGHWKFEAEETEEVPA